MPSPGVTLTFKLSDISGTGIPGKVVLTLDNFTQPPDVVNTAMVANLQYTVQAAANGTGSVTFWGNYQLNQPATYYNIQIFGVDANGVVNNAPNISANYQFNTGGTFDLSTLTPLSATPIAPGPPPPSGAVLLNPTGPQSILTYPLNVPTLGSEAAGGAASGFLRLAHPDTIDWRNFAGSADLALGVNTQDQLTFAGKVVSLAPYINVKAFGALGDGFAAPLNASMTGGSSTLTIGTVLQNGKGCSSFSPSHVGYQIVVPFAGSGSTDLFTTIATYVSATQVTLSVAANQSVHQVDAFWWPNGRDDTFAIQSAINSASASGARVYIPSGVYPISASLTNSTLLEGIVGDGAQASWLVSNSASNNHPALVLTDVPYRFVLSGLGFKGRGQVIAGGTENGVEFRLTQNTGVVIADINNLRILDYPGHGLYIQEIITSTISDCIFDDVGNAGLYLDVGFSTFGGTSVTISGCYSYDNSVAYQFQGYAYTTMVSCAADSNNTNYTFNNCVSTLCVGCGCEVALGVGTIGYIISGGVNNALYNCYWTKVPANDGVGVAVTGTATGTIIDGFYSNQPSITPLVDISVGASAVNTVVRNLKSVATTPVSNSGTGTLISLGNVFTGIGASTFAGAGTPTVDLTTNWGSTTKKWANIYTGNQYVYTDFGIRAGGTLKWSSTTDPTAAADTGISRDSAGVIDFGNGTQGDQTATLAFGTAQAKRLTARRGTTVVAGDFVPDANWGASTTVALVNASSKDHGGQVSIHCNGTVVANPTVVFTFHDGTWGTPPAVVICRGDNHAPTTGFFDVETVTATAVTFRFVGTPVSGTNYAFNWIAIGT